MSALGWKTAWPSQQESAGSDAEGTGFDFAERRTQKSQLTSSAKAAATAPKYLNRLSVRSGDKIVLIPVSDLVWIESHKNLLRLHLENASYEHRMTLKDMHSRLDPERFLRVHRGAIVNLDHVVEFELPRCGNAFVRLSNGKELPVSRIARLQLRRGLLSQVYTPAL